MSNRDMPKPPAPKLEESEEPKEAKPSKPLEAPKPSGIKVQALRPGFYGNRRKKEGDMFVIPDMDKLGSWMKCVDPEVEAKRQLALRSKKKSLAGK